MCTDKDVNKWDVIKVWYDFKVFDSPDALAAAWESDPKLRAGAKMKLASKCQFSAKVANCMYACGCNLQQLVLLIDYMKHTATSC